jgi:hypothetical protein
MICLEFLVLKFYDIGKAPETKHPLVLICFQVDDDSFSSINWLDMFLLRIRLPANIFTTCRDEPSIIFPCEVAMVIMDCLYAVSGASACIHLVTNTSTVHFPCTCTCMTRASSLLSVGWWLNWHYPSWTKRTGHATPFQVHLYLTCSSSIVKSINWWLPDPAWMWPYFVHNCRSLLVCRKW